MARKGSMTSPVDRRGLLRVVGLAVLAALSGCGGGGGEGSDATRTSGGGEATTTSGPEVDGSGTASPDPLDMREANVLDVAFEPGDGGYGFDVALAHDDDGEEGYADWWQVETVDGDRLGRRELLHAHGNEPFTRSTTTTVPEGVRCVVVRGHDGTHGYGGQAMTVDLETGATGAVRQGSEPRSTARADCPGE